MAFPFESLNAEKTTLKSHLTWQMRMAEMDEAAEAIGTLIIGNLDMDGYLRTGMTYDPHQAYADFCTVFLPHIDPPPRP